MFWRNFFKRGKIFCVAVFRAEFYFRAENFFSGRADLKEPSGGRKTIRFPFSFLNSFPLIRKLFTNLKLFIMTKDQMDYFIQICTNCHGVLDEKKFAWICEDFSKTRESKKVFTKTEKFSPTEYPKADIKSQQKSAMAYMINNFSREERLLIMFAQDSEKLLSCFSADKFKSESAKNMIIGELSETFIFLKKKMIEFRWNKKFLAEKGIDFIQLRNLYFQLCVS